MLQRSAALMEPAAPERLLFNICQLILSVKEEEIKSSCECSILLTVLLQKITILLDFASESLFAAGRRPVTAKKSPNKRNGRVGTSFVLFFNCGGCKLNYLNYSAFRQKRSKVTETVKNNNVKNAKFKFKYKYLLKYKK